MEIKQNDSTINRPEGKRVIDAPFVVADINEFTDQLLREESYEKNGKNGITVFKSDGLTQVITALKQGENVIENEVEGFVTIQVVRGEAELITPSRSIPLSAQQMVTLHPHLVHSFKASTDVVLLLTTVSTTSIVH